jgi:polysaccharide biosynthesis protein PslC
LLVIDSGSVDDTVPQALAYGAQVHNIRASDFNHGATREWGRRLVKADYYLFMTQDALPAHPQLLENLLKPLITRQDIGLVYGRQLPHAAAHPLEVWNRRFNYPATSQLKGKADRVHLGLKTVFCSNVCAIYRSAALNAVGGFPPVIICEDQYVAARMLEAGYSIYYAAEAPVFHSHNYSLMEEFRRYFDLGVFFGSQEPWIVDHFGTAGSEGFLLFQEGRRYLTRSGQPHLIPNLMLRLLIKGLGYQLGSRERFLSLSLKSRLSLHRNFWRN